MRLFYMRFSAPTLALLCFAGLGAAQQPKLLTPAPPTPAPPKAVSPTSTVNWSPRIDVLDFYGLHRVTPELIQQASGLHENAPLPPSPGDVEENIIDLPRVASAHLEAICCDEGKTILYIGIEERDAPRFEIRPAPGGGNALPESLVQTYQRLQDAMHNAERAGKPAADYSHGHPVMLDPAARTIQESLPKLVALNLETIREVLRESGDEYQRAIAAFLIGYTPTKSEIVEDLHFALTDTDPTVRQNAAQSLTALALLERDNPASKVHVSTTWFVDMLNSISWSDRMTAMKTLVTLTEDRDIFTLSRLHGAALDALVEMAHWKTDAHAQPAFTLIGRVAGMDDRSIQIAWETGNREPVIDEALGKK